MINIIYPNDGWILEKMADNLLSRLPEVRGFHHTDMVLYSGNSPLNEEGVSINYYINYRLFKKKSNHIDIAWFTHPEPDDKFYEIAQQVDFAICNCEKYRHELSERGVNAYTIIPGIDEIFRPVLKVGFVGRFSDYGYRKGSDILESVNQLNFVDLMLTNGEVSQKDLPDFYNKLDCVLIASRYEGGPMCLLEGLAMGKPIICPPDVGLASMFEENIIPYTNGDIVSLTKVLEILFEEKKKRFAAVKNLTWSYWAENHHNLFSLLEQGSINKSHNELTELMSECIADKTLKDTKSSQVEEKKLPTINQYALDHDIKEINLHLGCGGSRFDGWINIDNFDYEAGDSSRSGSAYDIKMDIRDLDVEEASVDNILLVHVLEHFVRWDAVDMMKYYYSKLKPGGNLYIEQPDLDGCIAWYLRGKEVPHIQTPLGELNMGFTQFYGNQWDRLDYETHRYVWTKPELQSVLQSIGYQVVQINNEARFHQSERDMFVVARKPLEEQQSIQNNKAPVDKTEQVNKEQLNQAASNKYIFSKIYEENHWGQSADSSHKYFSGSGSHSNEIIEPYINVSINFLNLFDSKPSVVDLGCGDFFVGSEIRQYCSHYIACDVVEELIYYNKEKFRDLNVDFRVLDLALDELPRADIVFIRQVFQHLSNQEILKTLPKLSKSYRYLVLTEHLPDAEVFTANMDIVTGRDTRLSKGSGIVLTEAPFNLSVKQATEVCVVNIPSGKLVTTIYQLS